MKVRKKRKKKPVTPRSKITSILRFLWMRSRERGEALKVQKRTCQRCGVKASVKKGAEQKIEVHHINGINVWKKVVEMVYDEILVKPDKLECLCPDCHRKEHQK